MTVEELEALVADIVDCETRRAREILAADLLRQVKTLILFSDRKARGER
jgi:hypothetical protein